MESVYLFRIKFIKMEDVIFVDEENLTPEQIFRNAIEEKPLVEIKKNSLWMIGNIAYLDDEKITGTFNVGRKSQNHVSKYNDNSRDFEDALEENSPNAKIFFNLKYEILGITNKQALSDNEFSLANKIKKLLEHTEAVNKAWRYVEITQIKNPEPFIIRLRNAYRIKRFDVHFSGQNPFDADAFFHKPMSAYLDATGGNKGHTIVEGQSLNAETCVQMAQSVAATGNDASARIKDSSDKKTVTISLSKNTAKVVLPDDVQNDDKKIIELIMKYYDKVRNDKS